MRQKINVKTAYRIIYISAPIHISANRFFPSQKHCLETIDTIEFGKNLTKNVSLLSKLGQETHKLLDKRIKETAQRYSRKRKMLEKDIDDSDSDACSLFSRYSR